MGLYTGLTTLGGNAHDSFLPYLSASTGIELDDSGFRVRRGLIRYKRAEVWEHKYQQTMSILSVV